MLDVLQALASGFHYDKEFFLGYQFLSVYRVHALGSYNA
jgi:hypothetical protein